MTSLDLELRDRLERIRAEGLHRELRRIDSPQSPQIQIDGRSLLNFSSNDYLGLANEPILKAAARQAIDEFGAGAGASRLICGSLAPHHQLEEALAEFKGTQAALTFSSGYAAALGVIGALLDKEDVVVIDKLVHASIVDAARLCGAKLRVFAHNDLNALRKILQWADQRQPPANRGSRRPRTLIVTESVFSMDGDQAPLREMVELKQKHGAWLMVDEAHATGIYGVHRRGLAESMGVSDRIEIQMGTLGKALGAAGGCICGSRPLIDYLIHRARSFVFSTAPTPATAGAAKAGVRFIQSEAGAARCAGLWTLAILLQRSLAATRWNAAKSAGAILPLIIGSETEALEIAAALRDQGIFVPAIRYPTVARGQARLRITVTAAHTEDHIAQLATALQSIAHRPSPHFPSPIAGH